MIGKALIVFRKASAWCISQAHLQQLGHAGDGIHLGEHLQLYGAKHIQIGHGTTVGRHVTLRAITEYPWTEPRQTFQPRLRIGSNSFISHFSHISCADQISIGNEVMIADRCFITDNQHSYRNPEISIKAQPLLCNGPVTIEDRVWIGTGACVFGNVTIGRHSVIGAHAVVTHDIPPMCVALGTPARVVKRFDPESQTWQATQPDGTFTSTTGQTPSS